MILKGIAKLIASKINSDQWYTVSYKLSRKYAKLKKISDQNLTAVNHAIKLEALLSLLTATGTAFPIPMRSKGFELFDKPRPNGLLLCSAHIPLVVSTVALLIKNGITPDAAIVKHYTKNDLYPLLGIPEGVPAIYNGPKVLLQAKTVLQKGGIVLVLPDVHFGGKYYSPNIFYLANRLKADIIYFFAELKPDGYIEASFYEAPQHCSNIDDTVKSQISALNAYRNKILKIEQDFVLEMNV